MKKSGGAQFSGTYIMYALVAIALLLLVIFIVRGSLVEHYTGATSSQWTRTRTQQNNNILKLTKTKSNNKTANIYKIELDDSDYNLKYYLKQINNNINSSSPNCKTITEMLLNAKQLINRIGNDSTKSIKSMLPSDKDRYKNFKTKFNANIDTYNKLVNDAALKCNKSTPSIIDVTSLKVNKL